MTDSTNSKKPSGIPLGCGSYQQGFTTMTIKTSRRAILAGVASLPALSLPAIASSAQTDPVFASIARHQEVFATLRSAGDKHDEFEEQHGPRPDPRARVKIGEIEDGRSEYRDVGEDGEYAVTWKPNGKTKPVYVYDVPAIERSAPRELSDNKKTAWIEARTAELKASERRLAKRVAKTEFGKLKAAYDHAGDAERDAAWDLIRTVPTTQAGLAAALAYIQKQQQQLDIFDGGEWLEIFLYSAERAVCSFAGLPEPPMTKTVSQFAADDEATVG